MKSPVLGQCHKKALKDEGKESSGLQPGLGLGPGLRPTSCQASVNMVKVGLAGFLQGWATAPDSGLGSWELLANPTLALWTPADSQEGPSVLSPFCLSSKRLNGNEQRGLALQRLDLWLLYPPSRG